VKTRLAIVSLTGLLGWTALAGPADAAPLGAGLETFPATCEELGDVTVTTGGGASFWLGDQHYLLTSVQATAPGGMTFEKFYGNRTGLGNEINCTATIEEPEGLVTVVVTAVAVP
jgi:hypothetical protein